MLAISSAGAVQAEAEKTPKEVYLEFHQAMLKADTVDAISGYMCAKVVDDIKTTPSAMKSMMFVVMKELAPKTVQVTSEKTENDHSLLTVESNFTAVGSDAGESKSSAPPPADAKKPAGKTDASTPTFSVKSEKASGTVQLVKENGVWKIEKESWKSKVELK